MNSNNQLASLNDQQLNQIYDWLRQFTYGEVQEKIAQPPPDGFGLSVSEDCLSRFYRRRRAEIRAADGLLIVNSPPPPPTERFHEAASNSFAHLTYETADSPAAAKNFIHLSNWFARRDHNEIKRQYLEVAKIQAQLAAERLELERKRLHFDIWKNQFNVARLSANNVTKIYDIINDPNIDHQDKIEKVRNVLLGAEAVEDLFSQANPELSAPRDADPAMP